MEMEQPETSRLLTFTWKEYESVCLAVVQAVAAMADTDPSELDPLYDAIDPDALDALCQSTQDPSTNPGLVVEFTYSDYVIQLADTGEGRLYGRK